MKRVPGTFDLLVPDYWADELEPGELNEHVNLALTSLDVELIAINVKVDVGQMEDHPETGTPTQS